MFIIFTSNAFALLGLRALILGFVGAKFIYGDLVAKIPVTVSVPFIALVVGISIAASLWATRGGPHKGAAFTDAVESSAGEPARPQQPSMPMRGRRRKAPKGLMALSRSSDSE